MEAHYVLNGCFMADGALMAGAPRLAGPPGVIVQARHDPLCPPATSHRFVAFWPEARIEMVEAAATRSPTRALSRRFARPSRT